MKVWEAEIEIYDYVIGTFWTWKLRLNRPGIVVDSELLYDAEADALRAARRAVKRLGLVEKEK